MSTNQSGPSLSPSRANDFMRCPLLFRLRALDRLPEPPSLAALRGTLVHAVLEALFELPGQERTPAAAHGLLPGRWAELKAKEPDAAAQLAGSAAEQEWLASADALVEAYFYVEDPTRLAPQGRELFVNATLPSGLGLRGFIDRLDVAPGSGAIRVVDYKTGKAPAERYQGEMLFQLRCYALAIYLTRGQIPALMQLLFLGNRQVVRNSPTKEDLDATELKLDNLWSQISQMTRRQEFPPVRSPLCGWCAFQDKCVAFGGAAPPFPEAAAAPWLGGPPETALAAQDEAPQP